MRPVELPYWHVMGDDISKAFAGKPDMQMKGRWLHLEGRFAQLREVEVDGMIGGWADGRRHPREHRERRTVDMARCDKLDTGMTSNDLCKLVCIEEVLAIHMPNAGLERRMV